MYEVQNYIVCWWVQYIYILPSNVAIYVYYMYVAMYNLPTECMNACMYVGVCVEGQCGDVEGVNFILVFKSKALPTHSSWCCVSVVVSCASETVHTFMYVSSTSLARCSEGLVYIPAFRVAKIIATVCSTVPMWDLLVLYVGVWRGPGYCLYYIIELYYLTVNIRFVMKVESTICALGISVNQEI